MDSFLLDSIFFSTSEDLVEFSLHISLNFSSTSRLPGCHLFFVVASSTLLDTRRLFSAVTDQKLFFSMPEEDLRWMKKPDHAFHARRHRPPRRHRELRLVAPRTPI